MSRTVVKGCMSVVLGVLLSGCGLTQTVSQGTTSTAKALFHPPLTTLQLDLGGPMGVNTGGHDMSTLAVPTLVRVYQLRGDSAVETAGYDKFVAPDNRVLGADLLAEHVVLVKPGLGAQLNVPLVAGTQFVVLVALFRQPDTRLNTWRLTLRRDQLARDHARVIELSGNALVLRPRAKE